jgi:Predicted transcriptional regulators
MEINQIIAENLKRLRNERSLSLGQLSELCLVSKVMLSQIEKGDTNPTINTLWKIANGLKVPYTSLLEQPEHDTIVIRRIDTEDMEAEDGYYRIFCYYNNTPNRNFEMFQIEMDEGCCYTSIGHTEKSQEYIMVVEGTLTLTVNDETFLLQPNDSICFDATAKHIYHNTGKGIMKAVNINFYPVL